MKKAGKQIKPVDRDERVEKEDTWCCFFSFSFVAVVSNTKLAKKCVIFPKLFNTAC